MEEKENKSKIKNIVRTLAVLAILVIVFASATVWSYTSKVAANPPNSNPVSNYNMTYEMAMEQDKPFLVMFHTEWCGYCKKFMPKFKMLSEQYKDKYNFVLIDGDNTHNYFLIRDFAIGGFPTIYIVDPTIENRILISNTLYDDIDKVKWEMNRYLRIRSMIKDVK